MSELLKPVAWTLNEFNHRYAQMQAMGLSAESIAIILRHVMIIDDSIPQPSKQDANESA